MIIDLGLNWEYYTLHGKRYRARYENGCLERQSWQSEGGPMGRWVDDPEHPADCTCDDCARSLRDAGYVLIGDKEE